MEDNQGELPGMPPVEHDWSATHPHVRRRHCPGCKTELVSFNLSATLMPIEQYAMGQLQSVNKTIGFSIRPFGYQNIHELQFLAFTSACPNCTLISSWDFGVEELDEILARAPHPPFAQIRWTYAPASIDAMLAVAPEWLKPNLQQLLNAITPKPNDKEESSEAR
ncbi:hypothetical protein [Burkholderia cepacia]|uniref:hypothetical protein n=1 Tax=Burkholderia cepacia TaxID=292 RepID=UPI0012DB044C|nr:hypothetical protein [Burkholderia cepacia]